MKHAQVAAIVAFWSALALGWWSIVPPAIDPPKAVHYPFGEPDFIAQHGSSTLLRDWAVCLTEGAICGIKLPTTCSQKWQGFLDISGTPALYLCIDGKWKPAPEIVNGPGLVTSSDGKCCTVDASEIVIARGRYVAERHHWLNRSFR